MLDKASTLCYNKFMEEQKTNKVDYFYKRHYIADAERSLRTSYETPLFLFFYEGHNFTASVPNMHDHPFTEIFYIISGDGEMHYNDCILPLRKNEVHIVPSGVVHCEAYVTGGEPLTYYVLNVENNFPFNKMNAKNHEKKILSHVFPNNDNFIFYLYKKILEDIKNSPPQCIYGIELALSQIYLELIRLLAPENESDTQSEYNISFVLGYIMEHFAEDVTLETLADIIHVSTVHLGKLFKKTYKMTPMQFLTNERIFHAKQLLHDTDLPITEVALRVGYNSPAYFTSVFKKAVGQTPSAYREFLG